MSPAKKPRIAAGIAASMVLGMMPHIAAADPAGAWSGTYICAQGLTALDLVLFFGPKGNLRGEFHFVADASNPGVPEGCYTLKGGFDAATGHVRLSPGRWLLRPAGYVMIGLDGQIDPAGTALRGWISPQLPGCTTFSLHPVDQSPAAPAACHAAATSVSFTPRDTPGGSR